VLGVTLNHAPPDAVAVRFSAVPLLVTDRLWVPEVVDPEAYVKVRVPGLMLRDELAGGVPATTKVTAACCGLLEALAVTVTVPV